MPRNLRNRRRHLLHGSRGLLGLLALLIHSPVNLVARRLHGRRAAGKRTCRVDHRTDDARQIRLHLFHRVGERAGLVVGVQIQRLPAQVTCGNRIGPPHYKAKRIAHPPPKVDRD